MKVRFALLLSYLLSVAAFFGQNTMATNGVHSKNKPITAFHNAVIHQDGDRVIKNGSLFIQDGKIIYVGGKKKTPENGIEIDLEGRHIYPSFIELNSTFGIKKEEKKKDQFGPQYESSKKGPYYWNEAIHPEENAIEKFTFDTKEAEKLRKMGFGTVLTQTGDGIARGTGCLISLTDNDQTQIQEDKISSHFSFQKGSSTQAYPTSLMGCIALLRQYHIDLNYYEQYGGKKNLSLEAGIANKELPAFFHSKDELEVLRAQKIASEYGLSYIHVGNGDEYQQLNEIQYSPFNDFPSIKPNGVEKGKGLVLPLNFPKPFDIEDPFEAMYVSLQDLKHWEIAPSNPMLMNQNGFDFSFSGAGIEKTGEFLTNLRKSVSRGLPENIAINALTKTPAQLIGRDDIGTLDEGTLANFIITSNDLINAEGEILENWVQGDRFEIMPWDIIDIRGKYNLNARQIIRTLEVTGDINNPKGKLVYDMISDSISSNGDLVLDPVTGKPIKVTKQKEVNVNISYSQNYINLSYQLAEGTYRLSGNINFDSGSWDGKGQLPDGRWINWTAIRKEKEKKSVDQKPLTKDSVNLEKLMFPMMAYGWDSLPKQKPILIKNATVWTLEEQGTLKTNIFIRDGKIHTIGDIQDAADPETIVIDGTDMHLTPGIIDEHSHIAISRGVNEGSHAVTAEVRIGDVINNQDINIYRQLAGGVTACQLLHGSANPAGGQSALIKLRWGAPPEAMKIDNADGFIKFALGENVKQSNWGDFNTIRFPQTRMGVEQVYYDAFTRAREYGQLWERYEKESSKKKSKAVPPKKDLQMEAMLEILNKERFITCHSYVQSEINMLMHVADSMGFTLNTFTHILEGYKVADKMKKHGAGGSTFSDWWAYKYEVKDAIPYNASLLNQMGIVTAINSDDAEMGRRLNQEAAKGIKYGGMTEEEALKMVTLNPAKLLHLDQRMGSIKVGKDADLVLWTANPLSIYAKSRFTIVDGIIYYDAERDKKLREEVEKERMRIIHLMIEAKNDGSSTQPIKAQTKGVHVCTSLSDDGN
ncbi:amidohydrolase family protein [Parvicella tangerina]|uniref:Imidazolonepropionase n=1 Tax=Parvicella tangerina TaxID=2829795 RepID=A0A916JQH8_9FLAO|nr:amidohydrolase family protein [Parvicella tangerina]CAG5085962.1 Imidazolonepropionase [Parvicella tangerina]